MTIEVNPDMRYRSLQRSIDGGGIGLSDIMTEEYAELIGLETLMKGTKQKGAV